MKRIRTHHNNENSSPETNKSRKQRRKFLKKQGKVRRAVNYAQKKKNKNICIHPSDVRFLDSKEQEKVKKKNLILENKFKNNHKCKSPKKVNSLLPATQATERSLAERKNAIDGFKMHDSTAERLIRLREYIDQEIGKKKKEMVQARKSNVAEVKEVESTTVDDKMISLYSKKLKLKKRKKKEDVFQHYGEDFKDILYFCSGDEEDNNLGASNNLDVHYNDTFNDDLKEMMTKNKSRSKTLKTKFSSSLSENADGFRSVKESPLKSKEKFEMSEDENGISESEIVNDDKDFEENDNEGLFDDEAIEDNQEYKSEDNENDEVIVFEGGGNHVYKRSSPTINSIFDMYEKESNSEDDEDLEDFIVDDDENVKFDSEASDNLSDLERKLANKRIKKKHLKKRARFDSSGSEISSCEQFSNLENEIEKTNIKGRNQKKRLKDKEGINRDITINDTHYRVKRLRIDSSCSESEQSMVKNLCKTDKSINKENKDTLSNTNELCENNVTYPSKKSLFKKKKQVSFSKSVTHLVSRDSTTSHEALNNLSSNSTESTTVPNVSVYIPPAQRKLMALGASAHKRQEADAVKKRLKGLLNRLTISNFSSIISEVEELFKSHSRNVLNESFCDILHDSMNSSTFTERLAQELAYLIAALSGNVGVEIGGHILTYFVLQWNRQVEQLPSQPQVQEVKTINNLHIFICYIYNFNVVTAALIFDMMNKLAQHFGQTHIELIILTLRSVGFALRKDRPLMLKKFISEVQSRAETTEKGEGYSKVCFMLEILTAIRNNNITKVPNYDPSYSQSLRRLQKSVLRNDSVMCELNVSLQDILQSDLHGKWWLVGSSWSVGHKASSIETPKPTNKMPEIQHSHKLLEKAKKLRLSRPPRINFLYIMTEGSDNYLDAFQKLREIKLSQKDEQEIFQVAVICCMKGKQFDPSFGFLMDKFCKTQAKYKTAFQVAVWEKFDQLSELKPNHISNLSKLITHVIAAGGHDLYLLKSLSFANADAKMMQLLQKILLGLLLHPSGSEVTTRVFSQLASSNKLQVLRKGVSFFITKFIKPNCTNENAETILLSRRVEMALNILNVKSYIRL